jgi:hypothetical protein
LVQEARNLYSRAAIPGVREVPIYGSIGFDSLPFVSVLAGTPPQRIVAALDVNVSGIAFPCKPCSGCEETQDFSFKLEESSSARELPCEVTSCAACENGKCGYGSDHFPRGTGLTGGFFFEDQFSFEDAVPKSESVKAKMACEQHSFDPSFAGPANGVVGLGPSPVTLDNILQDFYGKEHEKEDGTVFFSICLSEHGGMLTIDGWNEGLHKKSMDWVSLHTTAVGYQIQLSSLRVGSVSLQGAVAPAYLSTSESSSFFPTALYTSLRDGIEHYCVSAQGRCGGSLRRGRCWHIPSGPSSIVLFPPLHLSFKDSNASFEWDSNTYLRRQGSTNTWCYAFDDSGDQGLIIFGTSWMLYKDLVFDAWQGRLWIAPAQCPQQAWPLWAAAGIWDREPGLLPRPPRAAPTPAPDSPGFIEPLPQDGESGKGDGASPAPAEERDRRRGLQGGGVSWLAGLCCLAIMVVAFCFSSSGRAFIEGHRRVNLRENLMDDLGGRFRGTASSTETEGVTANVAAELASGQREDQVADEQE